MKVRTKLGAIVAVVLFAAFTSLSGCATTGMQRSEKAVTTMKTVEDDIRKAVVQIDVTNASLADLVKPGQNDIKKVYSIYSDNTDKMEDIGKRVLEHTEKMRLQGKDYFGEWQKQGNTYENPDIQALSEQRRADMSSIYVKISEASVGVKGSLKTYLTDIVEIKTYLSNDLTPKGVESITPIAEKAVTDGNNLKESLDSVLTAVGRARAELALGAAK